MSYTKQRRSGGQVAEAQGVPAVRDVDGTVQVWLQRMGPLATMPHAAKRALMLQGMEWLYLQTLDQVGRLMERGPVDAGDLRNYATTMAICVDKALLLRGEPTEIIGGIGEIRHLLPELAARLASVSMEGAQEALAAPRLDAPILSVVVPLEEGIAPVQAPVQDMGHEPLAREVHGA